MRKARIDQFLTEAEIRRAAEMYRESPDGFALRFCREVTEPNIVRINKALHQENDPVHLAYFVEYALQLVEGGTGREE